MRIGATAFLVLFLAYSLTFGAPPEKPQALVELEKLANSGKCQEALPRITAWREKNARDVEGLVLEANCRLSLARSKTRQFDNQRYDRFQIASGGGFLPAEILEAFYFDRIETQAAERDKALALLQKALESAPQREDLIVGTITVLVWSGRLNEAQSLLQAHAGKLGNQSRQELALLAQDMFDQGQNAVSERWLQTLAAAFPGAKEIDQARGRWLLQNFRSGEGLDLLLPLVPPSNDNLRTALEIGQLCFFARRWEDTIRILTPHLDKAPPAMLTVALARARQFPASAAELFQTLKKTVPGQQPPPKKLVAMADHYIKASSDPRRPPTAMRLRAASAFLEAGIPQAALVELDDAVEQDPKNFEAWRLMGLAYRSAGHFDWALKAIDQAGSAGATLSETERKSALSALALLRGQVLIGLGRDQEARQALEAAEAGGKSAALELGLLAEFAGNKPEAARVYQKALEAGADPDGRIQARLKILEPPKNPAP